MTETCITPEGAERIEAAHVRYVAALRELNTLRCAARGRAGNSGHTRRVAAARIRVRETFAEWVMLYQHETGRKISIAS